MCLAHSKWLYYFYKTVSVTAGTCQLNKLLQSYDVLPICAQSRSNLLTFLVSDSLDGRYCANIQYSPEPDKRGTNVKAVDVDMTILLETTALGSLQFETDIPIYSVQVEN